MCECAAPSSFLEVCFDDSTFLLALYTVDPNKDCFEFNMRITDLDFH